MMKETNREIYTGIDVCKLIAAILVVLLHAVETSDYYACGVKFIFTRFAVPFFFIASGFFFCKGIYKNENKKQYFYKYERNIIKIFFVWAILIYAPITISDYIKNNPSAGVLKIILLLLRRIFVIGSGPYWYLIALMWSAAFLYLCHVKKKEWLIKMAIFIGLLLQIAYTCFRGLLSNVLLFKYFFDLIYMVFSWEFNFIMYGIPFMGIGFYICKKGIRVPIAVSTTVFVVATLLRFLEYNLCKIVPNGEFWTNNEISIMYIIQAIFIFLLAKEVKFNFETRKSLCIRQLSSFIYFSHAIILYDILNPLLVKYTTLPIYSSKFILPKMMVVLVVCTILFVIIKCINNRKLNVLING